MRIFSVLYFVVLFAILGSYLIYATPDNALRLHVAAADTLAPAQNNMIAVWARDLKTGSIFDPGHTIEAQWITTDFKPASPDISAVALPQNGEVSLAIPKVPAIEVAGIEVRLKNSDQEILKTAILPASSFEQAPVVQYLKTEEANQNEDYYSAFAPAAFMFNAPNEVFITAIQDGVPVQEPIQIEQIYGHQKADFSPTVKASKSGITRTHITLNSPADFKFTIGEKVFYATFVPGDKPLHAAIAQPLLTPEDKPLLKVTPVAGMPTVYIDYFYGDAWIDRQIIPPHEVPGTRLNPRFTFPTEGTQILYARVAASALPTPETAQTFPLIATQKALSPKDQTKQALKLLDKFEAAHPESHALKAWFSEANPSQAQARAIRDYALALCATHHAPAITMKVKSEDVEAQIFHREKQTQKRISNIVIVIWFALGIIVYATTIMRRVRERRRLWKEITESGTVPADVQLQNVSPIQVFFTIFLGLGFIISLIYVMQII